MLAQNNFKDKISLLLLFICSLSFSQSVDLSAVWINGGQHYEGKINTGTDLKLYITHSSQSTEADLVYNVAGYSTVRTNTTPFNGVITITGQKKTKSEVIITGHYSLSEEGAGRHSGALKGDLTGFIAVNDLGNPTGDHQTSFSGSWKSRDATLLFKTNWKNK
ncbi:hypothetical protein J8J42_01265 [Chryseobacterium sp. cx-311]|uniref:hypothetical protein n=1 Tax=Marnyiella aurantia TaxID=2758037 RepID=UPI001AE208DE|nr:hypothetical protein [Marnyiella aurantia]MBP0611672.1 hypothetical protein [Marnyiella aurantia]